MCKFQAQKAFTLEGILDNKLYLRTSPNNFNSWVEIFFSRKIIFHDFIGVYPINVE